MAPTHKSLQGFVLACSIAAVVFYFVDTSVNFFDSSLNKGKIKTAVTERNNCMNGIQQRTYKQNKSKQYESCSKAVPSLIIQYGSPRTATTLQFSILCLMMALLHEDEINNVGCYFNKKKYVSKFTVIKCHRISNLLKTIPSNSWVFMTSSDALSLQQKHALNSSRQKIKDRNITIPYVADVNLVSKRGHFIVYEYQPIFGLSDEKMQYIVEYLRYWDILRVCCGKQMSADWRNHLSPTENYKPHHNPHSSTYPACEMYNISQVELHLLNTYVFKKFGHTDSLRNVIGKPSIVDGKLDGSYCERCNTNIAKRNLKFNKKCI